MQNLKREKDRLSVENDSLREVNTILNNNRRNKTKWCSDRGEQQKN